MLNAWALGAGGSLITRTMVYELGAMGESGVSKALQILHKELDVSMAHAITPISETSIEQFWSLALFERHCEEKTMKIDF